MTPIAPDSQPVGAPVPGWGARPFPARVERAGRTVTVAPVSAAHVRDLYDAVCGPDDAWLWTYRPEEPPADLADLTARVEEWSAATDRVTFALVPVDTGRAAGLASLMRVDAANGVVEVGAILYAASLQRTTAATEAMWLLMRYVFDDLGYRRYEWKLDSHNAPSAAAARRLGFTYEGRFRNAMVYKGRNRDTDWFAMTDADWSRLRPAYDAWLAPSNFDGSGAQRRTLAELRKGT